jgi:formylglycine-generating enzyme required for sulfatase activity
MKYFFILISIILCFGCENKPKQKIVNPLGMNFVYVEPGTFMFGPKNEFLANYLKHPQHKVTLTKGFYMQTTETTVSQWRAFVKKTGFKTQAEKNGYGYSRHGKRFPSGFSWLRTFKGLYWDNPGYKHTEQHPVTQISWNDVQIFIKWLNKKYGVFYRLPSEAEWEYACRAGTSTDFYFGNMTKKGRDLEHIVNNELGKNAWYEKKSKGYPHPVGLKAPNPWGLYDMYGNVKELCLDHFRYSFSGKHHIDPINFDESKDKMYKDDRIYRGSGWHSIPATSTSSIRGRFGINDYSDLNGFRVVKDVVLEDYEK